MPVDPARAKSLFLAASDLADPAERAAYLGRECGDDAELRARVEALLRADDAAPLPGFGSGNGPGAFPSGAPATGTFGAASAEPTTDYLGQGESAGAVIAGKYTLVEVVGEGGMGSVWRARQTDPVKRFVAVKLIKAGMDSRQVLARFEAERQALALMDHPNIAKVLDGGVHDGRPFFVMELVKGVPVTEYCDARKLTPKDRLELFVPVCQAIQHAHQKGVIHRDVKPSNVLVALYDDRPVVKVIDFGVAKATGAALTERTIDTGFGGVVGTPEYMSPEQATFNNLDIDTRSDVYALGVLLYELLTGSPPFARKELERRGLLEMLRVVREEEPPRPSTKLSTADALPSLSANRGTEPKKLTGLLRNELDWVVMKALEKDRGRRYETANAFAADVQRYLAGEAVQAHPPSVAYRFKKFVRRNKGQVVAAGLVLAALVAGMAGTVRGLIEARRQEQIARDETAEKEQARRAEAERVTERDAALKAEGERADELRHRLGVSAMVLANAAFDNRDLMLAAERLETVPAGQRGWEWRYLKRQLDGGIFTIRGHKGAVRSVAFSPDGTRIVTGAGTERGPFEAKVWDAQTGTHLFDLKGLPQSLDSFPVVCVAVFSGDGKRILTAGGDQTARVWDATTGALRLELSDHPAEVSCAAFSPDGTKVVTAYRVDAGVVKVWDAKSGKPVLDWKAHKYGVRRLAFSPDGTRILTGGVDQVVGGADQAVKVWDSQTGTNLLDAKGMMSEESGAAFSPDGKRIVAGRQDGTARVIDARTGEVLLVLRGRPRVQNAFSSLEVGVVSVAYSPDGTRIVIAGTTGAYGNGEASVWDARTGVELLELKGHTGTVLGAAFSPDGQRIITGSWDQTARVWDAHTGTPRLELDGIKAPILSHAMSADGQWIVTGTASGEFEQPGETTIWDARTGAAKHVLNGFKGPVHSVAISRDGTRIVAGGGIAGEEGNLPTGPDGAPLIDPNTPGLRKTVAEAMVWDAHTRQPLVELKGLKEVVTSVAFSPDGTRIVTGGGEAMQNQGSEVKVWDARTGTLLLDLTEPTAGGVRPGARVSVAFSPDGTKFVAAGARTRTSMGEGITVRNARTGATELELKGNEEAVLSVAFSTDGARIATTSADKTATIWDAEKGVALAELKGHTGHVNCVAFSPDGKRIATGGGDRTVRVWDARTGTTLAELKAHAAAITSVSFSADGRQVITTGRESPAKRGEVIVWDAPTPSQEANADEIAYRRFHTQPNPSRYRANFLAARAAKDEFASAFYLNLIPPDDRKEALAKADAEAFVALNTLATEYRHTGKLDEAVPLLVEILNINKAKRGPEDPATIEAAYNLGSIYLGTGEFGNAFPLLEAVLKVRKAKLGPGDPRTLELMGLLGRTYMDAGRFQEAIAVLEEGAGKDWWVTLNLLDAYALAGEHAKVVALGLKQLEVLRMVKEGDVAGSKAEMQARLGRAYLAQKKWADAELHLRECVAIHEKIMPGEWRTFDALSMLGGSLLGQKKSAEAEPLLLKGYEGLKQREKSIEPRDAARLPEALDRLIELNIAANKPDEAKKWRAERAKCPAPIERAPRPREAK